MATTFRLGRLLRLRTQLRAQQQHTLATRIAEARARDAEREALAAECLRVGLAEAAAAETGMLGADELRLRRSYADVLAARERAAAERARAAHALVAATRETLKAARREERRFERLAETHRARAAEAAEREAGRMLDEFAVVRFGRARREERNDGGT